MPGRTLLRLVGATLAGALGLVAPVALVAGPATAAEHPTQRATADQKKTVKSYPAIAGQAQVQQLTLGINGPADCNPTYCDQIPVEVDTPPGYSPEKFYLLTTMQLDWVGSADMDMYVFYFGKDEADPASEEEWRLVGTGAGSDKPEAPVSTERLKVLILVVNSSGVNNGYSISLQEKIEEFTAVTEAPDPTSPGFSFGDGPTTTATFATGGDDLPTTTTSSPPGPDGLPLDAPISEVPPDPAAQAFTPQPVSPGAREAIDLSGRRRQPISTSASGREEVAAAPVGPASVGSVLGVLVGVPVALAAVGGGLLRLKGRRVKVDASPSALPPDEPTPDAG